MKNESELFNRLSEEFYSLTDSDPSLAIQKARNLDHHIGLNDINCRILKSAVFIDAGVQSHNLNAIEEGCRLLRILVSEFPELCDLHYNLANGLIAQADETKAYLSEWYLLTADTRREARKFFQFAATKSTCVEMQGRALTNLANALNRANRWVEAYDMYLRALKFDPTNAVASTGAARILLRCAVRGICIPEDMERAISKHLEDSRMNEERLKELAGEKAYQELKELLQSEFSVHKPPMELTSDYMKFVAEYHLALNPSIVGMDPSLKRWDTLIIHSIVEKIDKESGVPSIFAMFNAVKGEYLLARQLVFESTKDIILESGHYSDTLDFALYGTRPTMLTTAQRMCMDILDKVAVAVTEYLGLEDKPRSIAFRTRWFSSIAKGSERSWHPIIGECLQNGNFAVAAMADLALDISDDGFLFEKKAFRDAGTHRFIVLHDMGSEGSSKSRFVDHTSWNNFFTLSIESLRLARAALIYFVEFITVQEKHKHKDANLFPMYVPSHHWIRGEEE